MVIHDLTCICCGHVEDNRPLRDPDHLPRCPACSHIMVILWSSESRRLVTVHPNERAVVWMNRKTGSVAYPPVNNVGMPDRYKNNGYRRVEFKNLHALDRFCSDRKLVNEKASFDNSGHADEL